MHNIILSNPQPTALSVLTFLPTLAHMLT